MNYLCICQYGHNRSIALTRVLHRLNQVAVAIGWSTSGDAIVPLSAWADRILLVDGLAQHHVPPEHHHKTVDFDAGPHRWSSPPRPELLAIFEQMVAERLPEIKVTHNAQ